MSLIKEENKPMLSSYSLKSKPLQNVGLTNSTNIQIIAKRQEIVRLYQSRPKGIGKCEWIETIAKRQMVSPATIRRELSKAETPLMKQPKKQKALTAWDSAAVEYMVAYYLKAIKEVGECSRKNAYLATIAECERQGWKYGAQTSAYNLLAKVDPMLINFARGGDRALDNYFYIARDLTILSPMQIVVGDQHIFDWWVEDKESGRIFRPECYLWLDMRTRIIYGIAFAKMGSGYNSDTVRSALRMGLTRFGKFQRTYNDNGKPEISKFITQIVNDIAAYGMQLKDNSDLYKTNGGYVIEDINGQIVGTVKTKEEWEEKTYRSFAVVKNAKAKPIERFFSTLEQILMDLQLPGRIKPLACSAPVEEENQKRLDAQKKNGLLLSPEEFQLKVFEALEIYEGRKHATFGRSPREELMSLYNKGWRPTFIDSREVDFIFFNRDKRKVRNGRVLIDGVTLEGEPLKVENGRVDESIGLTTLEGQEIEVRWNPDDPTEAFAVTPGPLIRPLREVFRIDSMDREQVSKALEWKKQQKKAVREKYKAFTSVIEGKVVRSSTAGILEKAEEKRKELPVGLTQEQLETQAKQEEQKQKQFSSNRIAFPKTHKSPLDRYKWCLDQIIGGRELTKADHQFVKTYEEGMTDNDLLYWENYKALGVK